MDSKKIIERTNKNDHIDKNFKTSVHYKHAHTPLHTHTPLQNNIHVCKVHCGSAFGPAFPGHPITAHYLYAFLVELEG